MVYANICNVKKDIFPQNKKWFWFWPGKNFMTSRVLPLDKSFKRNIGQVLQKKHCTIPLKRKYFRFHGTIAAVPIFLFACNYVAN